MSFNLPFGFNRTASNDAGSETIGINTQKKYPFYIKAPMVLLGLYLLFNILIILQDIVVPICFALLIAILLNPVVNRLHKWGVPRVLAITLALLTAVILLGSLIIFLSSQFADFSDLAPQFQKRGIEIWTDLQQWIQSTFGVSFREQKTMISEGMEKGKEYVGTTLSAVLGAVSTFILIPIYVFMILFYKPMFINFFYEVFDYKHGKRVSEVLNETKSAIQSYIMGLLIEMCIVAVLNSTALLIIGVKYAILLGVVGAILNVIPYIGGVIAIALPVAISLTTGTDLSFTTPLVIIGVYTFIQLLDNNVIVPRVVSSKVEVNALMSIIIVLLGGALWGISGMFLAIPFVAILKIIFDRIEELQPWGMLLGSKMNPNFTLHDLKDSDVADQKSAIQHSAEDPDIAMSELDGKKEDSDSKDPTNPI